MPTPDVTAAAAVLVWPEISQMEYMEMWAIPVVFTVLIAVWMNCIWTDNLKLWWEKPGDRTAQMEEACGAGFSRALIVNCCDGEVVPSGTQTDTNPRQYSQDWKKTFDFTFLMIMVVVGLGLVGVTWLKEPELFRESTFWFSCVFKLLIMFTVSIIGGLTTRQFLKTDNEGYIIGDTKEDKASKGKMRFKVNYTRKFQHFSAYAIPLVIKANVPGNPVLHLIWGDFFTLIGFLVLIKPIRENFKPFMLMFNSLDRPEDRPNTLPWIIAGNIIPGLVLIVFFDWLFLRFGVEQQKLVMIFVLVAGVGDGLAEPVGIRFGRHKYRSRSCGSDAIYQRSFEGSACVFISTFIWIIMFYHEFENATQFWLLMLILPMASTLAEAVSPHTMDTPFLMGLGGMLIYILLRWF